MVAPYHIIFIPIWKTEEEKAAVSDYISSLTKQLDNRTL
jgi:hypothetical protein